MRRTLITLGTNELIAYAKAEVNDLNALNTCLHEISFRNKAKRAGKFDELIPWIESKIEEISFKSESFYLSLKLAFLTKVIWTRTLLMASMPRNLS